MDSFDHIRIGVDVVFNAGDGLRIGKQTLHFRFRAAVTEFEVIEHGVVLLGKALIGVLYGRHIGTHLIGVVRHICDGHVSIFHSFFRITAQGGYQACGEARDRLHIVVCRHPRRLIGVCRILLELL